MSSSNSPCAACKFRRQKCTQECLLAPYFPPDQPQKFANVHKVFGASNVTKLLNELNAAHREDAVNSLAYEAEARLRDPVYGCVGMISFLQQKLKQVQTELLAAKKELSTYIGPSAMLPILQHAGYMPQQQHVSNSPSSLVNSFNMSSMPGLPAGPSHGGQLSFTELQAQQFQQYQHMLETQQLAADSAREHLDVFSFKSQQQQEELARLNSGFNTIGASGFNQMTVAASTISPSMALGTLDNPYQLEEQQQEHQLHPHLLHQAHSQPPHLHGKHQGSGSEVGSDIGPSC